MPGIPNLGPMRPEELGSIKQLTDLGYVTDTAGSNVSDKQGRMGNDAWLRQLQDELETARSIASSAAPVQPRPVASGIAGVLGAVAGGLLGGGEGMLQGFQGAAAGGLEAEGVNQERALQGHANKIAAATSVIEERQKLASGVRMILQSQPDLLVGTDSKVLGELAFPGSGLEVHPGLQDVLDRQTNDTKSQIDAWKFIVQQSDNADLQSTGLKEIAKMQGISPAKIAGWTAREMIDQNGKVNPQWIKENYVNYVPLIEDWKQGRLDLNKGVPRPETDSMAGGRLNSMVLEALARYRTLKLQNPDWTESDTMANMDPKDQVILPRYFPGTFGSLSIAEASRAGERSLTATGTMGAMIEGALEDPAGYAQQTQQQTIILAEQAKQRKAMQTAASLEVKEQARIRAENAASGKFMSEAEVQKLAADRIQKRLTAVGGSHIQIQAEAQKQLDDEAAKRKAKAK